MLQHLSPKPKHLSSVYLIVLIQPYLIRESSWASTKYNSSQELPGFMLTGIHLWVFQWFLKASYDSPVFLRIIPFNLCWNLINAILKI
jgi:hypothetical protein